MTERMFRLLELHQKLDASLRRKKAARREIGDFVEITLLTTRKLKLRNRLARQIVPPVAVASL
ncbi:MULTISPECIES: DUF465 domain-containing protein [Novosphingobium]|jgi:uncharacterized protein YdcH (DUF465 family)|uniref:DUF465 domain-containing protein n=1 Tax=Novosphingobium panipatense TaxID=428991 RepID=A0ABY1Q728_9SPHN|nr:DUF465 domain-containing protein [Novosphingobium sp. HII-3]SMP61731.1 hypothetical protein SAMN06296065_103301 [Novosphingobium panipatense]